MIRDQLVPAAEPQPREKLDESQPKEKPALRIWADNQKRRADDLARQLAEADDSLRWHKRAVEDLKVLLAERDAEIGRLRANWLAEQKARLDQADIVTMYSSGKLQQQLADTQRQLNQTNTALQSMTQRCKAHYVGTKCFSCGVEWKEEIHNQSCDQAHREHWGHEWVSQRVINLTDKVVNLQCQLEATNERASKPRPS